MGTGGSAARSILSRGRTERAKKYIITAQRSVEEKASGRIARAPRLSCLYKQALIFLSTPGTSAIYSQPGGRVAGGLQEILLQSR